MVLPWPLTQLTNPDARLQDITSLIRQNPGLSIRILRAANSTVMGNAKPINSIHRTTLTLGLARIRHWTSLLILGHMEEQSRELLELGLIRVNFCQTWLATNHQGDPKIGYTVGLLSILDALLGMPIAHIPEHSPLPPPLDTALIEHQTPYGEALQISLAFEGDSYQPLNRSVRILISGKSTRFIWKVSKRGMRGCKSLTRSL